MRLLVRDDTANIAPHAVGEVSPEIGDRNGIAVDIETFVIVLFEHRAQPAIRLINQYGELSNTYLLAGEIDPEANELSIGWSRQCETAVSATAPDSKEEAEKLMREIVELLHAKIRDCLVRARPVLSVVR